MYSLHDTSSFKVLKALHSTRITSDVDSFLLERQSLDNSIKNLPICLILQVINTQRNKVQCQAWFKMRTNKYVVSKGRLKAIKSVKDPILMEFKLVVPVGEKCHSDVQRRVAYGLDF